MPADDPAPPPDAVGPDPDVGEFRSGTPLSRWALARYLVGRVIAVSVRTYLLVVGVFLIGLAAVLEWAVGSTFWALVVGGIAVLTLGLRAGVGWLLDRLTAAAHYRPLANRLRRLVRQTRVDVLAELRRIGLPGRMWSLPLLAWRLARPYQRIPTLNRLRSFDVDRAVTPARIDELHHILRAAVDRRDHPA